MDAFGDHAFACTRTGFIARRAKILERAWVRVARMGKWSPNSGWRTQQHLASAPMTGAACHAVFAFYFREQLQLFFRHGAKLSANDK